VRYRRPTPARGRVNQARPAEPWDPNALRCSFPPSTSPSSSWSSSPGTGWFILSASFFFYGYWFSSRDYLPLASILAFSIVVNWAFGRWVHQALTPEGGRTSRSRWLVRAAVVVDLGVLAYFKYVNFFVSSVAERLAFLGIHSNGTVLNVILPIGISFFTFQAISYVIDIGRGVWREPVPLLDFAVYLSFFAHLVAGPIVRASEFIPRRSCSSSGACSRRS
jgi:alginate O-acetyltransferase complex protein AlgI